MSGVSTCSDVSCFRCSRQHQQEGHRQTVASLSAQLADVRLQLRRRETERREVERAWRSSRDDWETQEGKLLDNLDRRDRLIEVASPL